MCIRDRYIGAESAVPSPGLLNALEKATSLVFCPSNPYLSLGPILALPTIRRLIKEFSGKRVCVSPIVGCDAVKGPAGKIMGELGKEVSSVEIAREYQDVCDVLVIDHKDSTPRMVIWADCWRPGVFTRCSTAIRSGRRAAAA